MLEQEPCVEFTQREVDDMLAKATAEAYERGFHDALGKKKHQEAVRQLVKSLAYLVDAED